MKKKLIKFIAFILLAALPFTVFAVYTETRIDPYSNTYLAAFEDQYERLRNTEGKKIVFIGGSSLPFGLRSDLIAQDIEGGYAVVDFGLYATLGTKFMMDMARDSIGEGDIIVLSPELNSQTYSLYFNPEATLEACGGLSLKLLELPLENQLSLAYNYYKYAAKRIEHAKDAAAHIPTDIYSRTSFNGYGDIDVNRENNIMVNGYDSNMTVTLDDSLFDEEFFEYVNEFVAYAEKQGATVYFNYSPVNRLAIRTSKAARVGFEAELKSRLDCALLGNIEKYLIDERYFYDTNFHLNSSGAVYFSRMLSLLLKEQLGLPLTTNIELPEPPALAEDETVVVDPVVGGVAFEDYRGEPNNDYIDYFIYELTGSSYTIVGVKDEYLGMKEVILPSVYEGKNVSAVASSAFVGCTDLVRIHIGTTYKSLAAASFEGCISLEGIYLYESEGNKIAPPTSGLLDGCPKDVKIYIPEDANYIAGYVWSNYSDYFEIFDKGE